MLRIWLRFRKMIAKIVMTYVICSDDCSLLSDSDTYLVFCVSRDRVSDLLFDDKRLY